MKFLLSLVALAALMACPPGGNDSSGSGVETGGGSANPEVDEMASLLTLREVESEEDEVSAEVRPEDIRRSVQERRRKFFAERDLNGDGKINGEELEALRAAVAEKLRGLRERNKERLAELKKERAQRLEEFRQKNPEFFARLQTSREEAMARYKARCEERKARIEALLAKLDRNIDETSPAEPAAEQPEPAPGQDAADAGEDDPEPAAGPADAAASGGGDPTGPGADAADNRNNRVAAREKARQFFQQIFQRLEEAMNRIRERARQGDADGAGQAERRGFFEEQSAAACARLLERAGTDAPGEGSPFAGALERCRNQG